MVIGPGVSSQPDIGLYNFGCLTVTLLYQQYLKTKCKNQAKIQLAYCLSVCKVAEANMTSMKARCQRVIYNFDSDII